MFNLKFCFLSKSVSLNFLELKCKEFNAMSFIRGSLKKVLEKFRLFHRLALILAIALIYIASRIPFIKTNSPTCWVDEFYYSSAAFFINSLDFSQFKYDFTLMNPFGTLFSTVSLFLFGPNYFGLRMGGVIAGLITIFVVAEPMRKKVGFYLLMLVLFLFDFGLFYVSWVNTPLIYKAFSLACVLYLYRQYLCEKIHPILMGCFAALFGWIVYPTNFYVLFAVVLFEILHFQRRSATFLSTILIVVGLWNAMNFFHAEINPNLTMLMHTHRISFNPNGFLKVFLDNYSFAHSPFVLIFVLLNVGAGIFKVFKGTSEKFENFLIIVLLSYVGQSTFYNSYLYLTCGLTFLIISGFLFPYTGDVITNFLREIPFPKLNTKSLNPRLIVIYGAAFLVLTQFKMAGLFDGKSFIQLGGGFSVVVGLLFVLIGLFKKISNQKHQVICLVLLIALAPTIYYVKILSGRSTTRHDFVQDIYKIVGDREMVVGLSFVNNLFSSEMSHFNSYMLAYTKTGRAFGEDILERYLRSNRDRLFYLGGAIPQDKYTHLGVRRNELIFLEKSCKQPIYLYEFLRN